MMFSLKVQYDDQIIEYGKLKTEMVNSETPIEVLLKMNKLVNEEY